MPVGTSLGGYFDDDAQHAIGNDTSDKEEAINIRPVGGSTEPAGALKSKEGTQVAPQTNASPEAPERDSSKDIYVNPWVTITPEDIDTGINVGLSAGPGTMAGVKSAAIGSKLADLGHAQVLEVGGSHPDDIHQMTGFSRGVDGRWRYEIDDSKSVFDKQWADNPTPAEQTQGFKVKYLNEVLDHPELYNAYPDLKNVLVKYDNKYPSNGAMWDESTQTITMGKGAHNDQGTLMHEIQHAIQDREGFAQGGAPGIAGKDFTLKLEKDWKAYVEQSKKDWEVINQKYKDKGAMGLSDADFDKLDYMNKVNTKYDEYVQAANKESLKYYARLAGEVEARNASTRLLLNAKERRAIPPSATEDVAKNLQIPVSDPALATAYGVRDPKTGNLIKSTPKSEPTQFRRGANDNEAPMDMSSLDKALKDHFYETVQKPHEEFIKAYDELHEFGQKLSQKGGWTELNVAKYNKMGRELNPEWENIPFE